MAKLSIAYGVIFILMGLISYFGISSESITALISAFIGIPMLNLGSLGLNEKYLKHAMHGATVLMLLGFFGTIGGLIKFFNMLSGVLPENPAAVTIQAIMSLMCLIFLILAVKSFAMAKPSIACGVIFILMGLISYFGISSESITALIPTFFGIPMLILGWLGLKEKYIKHAMHGAAVLMLLGFFGTVGGLIKFFKMLSGIQLERPAAVTVQAIMAVMCLLFLIFAIKSFIDARKNRKE